MQKIINELKKTENEFIELRHYLHMHPEIGFEEVETSKIISQKLQEWGYEVHTGLAKTGVVATLKVGEGTKKLGLRADIDALPMQETGNKTWSSTVANKMHACGHDGHTATLLCAAKYLAQSKNFNGTLNLIFQPAEELLYGGRVMMEDGLFDKFPCDAIFGMHNMPGYKEGVFYFKEGSFMASADTIHIEVKGVGGHGAIPQVTIDPTLVACYITIALQSIVSRNISPFDQAVVTVGSIQAGQAANIINDKALLKLSLRALNPHVRKKIVKRVEEIATAQAQSFGATVEISHINGCPVLVNDKEMTEFAMQVAKDLLGEEKTSTDISPFMGSEDFAFMLEHVKKGCYLAVGTGDGPDCPSIHNPKFDFNDNILIPAAAYWCTLTEKYLK